MDNAFFSRFTPKEPKFIPILKELSGVMLVTSELMMEFIKKYDPATASDFQKQIKEQEKKGDLLSNHLFDELDSTFITPFDREDIHQLASRMDDVIDSLNSCAKKIAMYQPEKLPESAIIMAGLIKEGTVFISEAIDELEIMKKDVKRMKSYCAELHDVENRADDVYEQFIIGFFKSETNGVEIIKVKEIMSELEKTTDVAEQVGKIIKTIIIKNA